MLVRYFTLIMLAVGQLNFLAKLLMEEQRYENTAVGRLAHRHDRPGTDAGQQEGLVAAQQEVSDEGQQEGLSTVQQEVSDEGQQEGLSAVRQEVSDEGQQEGLGALQQGVSDEYQQEGNHGRHPRNISILRPPPRNPPNPLAQRLEELVARYEEVSESLMPAVRRARQVIEEDVSGLNFRDATIRTFFFVSFLLEFLGFATNVQVVSHSLPNIFWRLMASGNYIVLFSWPHIHTEVFGADTIPLPCSEEDANRTLNQMATFQPENLGQLAVNVENARIELEIALHCVLARGHKFGEAAEVGLVRNQLLQIYNEKLHLQVPRPPSIPDASSLSHVDQALVKYRSSLPGFGEQSTSNAIRDIDNKNEVITEGLAFGGVALFATLMSQMKDQEDDERIGVEHLKPESNAWKLILKVISQLKAAGASTSAGIAYKLLLAVGYEDPSVIDCGGDDMRRALALFPLLETPADILTAAGTKRRAKQMVVDLGEAIRRNMYCIIYRPQAIALSVNVNAYLNLLNIRIDLS